MAEAAQNEFINVVQNKGVPEDIPEYKIENDISIIELISSSGIEPSKSQIKRLLSSGAVKIDSEKISDMNYIVKKDSLPLVVQVGKRKFVKVTG